MPWGHVRGLAVSERHVINRSAWDNAGTLAMQDPSSPPCAGRGTSAWQYIEGGREGRCGVSAAVRFHAKDFTIRRGTRKSPLARLAARHGASAMRAGVPPPPSRARDPHLGDVLCRMHHWAAPRRRFAGVCERAAGPAGKAARRGGYARDDSRLKRTCGSGMLSATFSPVVAARVDGAGRHLHRGQGGREQSTRRSGCGIPERCPHAYLEAIHPPQGFLLGRNSSHVVHAIVAHALHRAGPGWLYERGIVLSVAKNCIKLVYDND